MSWGFTGYAVRFPEAIFFVYNLNDILSRLIYTRILYPSSKKSSSQESRRFIEQPSSQLHDIYRALSVMAEESDYIQSRPSKNSSAIQKRKTQVIYYDCINFYFDTNYAEDDKQFGKSKEGSSLPIVRMGLFMDMDGIPISFSVYPGNRNEQITMIPLEKNACALRYVKVHRLYRCRSFIRN